VDHSQALRTLFSIVSSGSLMSLFSETKMKMVRNDPIKSDLYRFFTAFSPLFDVFEVL
jgi:hypothetical protein